MKLIKVGKEQLAKIDDEDFLSLTRWKWKLNNVGYAVRSIPRYDTLSGQGTLLMHRFILDADRTDVIIDHIDGDKLNNQKENLRVATSQENSRNRCKILGRHYKGVRKRAKKWTAHLWNGEKELYLGTYPTPEEAAWAYDDAARTHFGNFARLNFPDDL